MLFFIVVTSREFLTIRASSGCAAAVVRMYGGRHHVRATAVRQSCGYRRTITIAPLKEEWRNAIG